MPTELRYGQQWTDAKARFAWTIAQATPINNRVILAWMAVESGGATDHPAGARYNYLQLMGEGGELMSFPSPLVAAVATLNAIRARDSIIRSARGAKSVPAQMKAIAQTWRWGSDNPQTIEGNPKAREYLANLRQKAAAISDEELREFNLRRRASRGLEAVAGLDVSHDLTAAANLPAYAADKAAEIATKWVRDLLEGAWPVLLQAALATTGLALMGYGLKKMAGAGAAEHATQAAPVTANLVRGAQ